jgi:hypothetical protein|uniref:Uncharacterized protein n=1 Tax=viral metagenome TaxID=1070528 RepID=A0A6C0ILR9_9ZZZZ
MYSINVGIELATYILSFNFLQSGFLLYSFLIFLKLFSNVDEYIKNLIIQSGY